MSDELLFSLCGFLGFESPELLIDYIDNLKRDVDYQVHMVRRHCSGGMRRVISPYGKYDRLIKEFRRYLEMERIYLPAEYVTGFCRGRGTRSNAGFHLNKDCVLAMDIYHFFDSISRIDIESSLRKIGMSDALSSVVARAASPEGVLATGLSISPLISNIVFQETDIALSQISAELDLSYSRYADDLTFSGKISDEIFDAIVNVLNEHDWVINKNKTRFMRRGRRQYVTGLSVSDSRKPHAPRKLRRFVRLRTHILEKYGERNYINKFGPHELRRLEGLQMYIENIEASVPISKLL